MPPPSRVTLAVDSVVVDADVDADIVVAVAAAAVVARPEKFPEESRK